MTFHDFLWDLRYGLAHYFAPFHNYPLLKAFYDYPLIKYLGDNHRSSKPSYIASRDFAETMIHLLTGDSTGNTHLLQLIQTNLRQNNISRPKAEKETAVSEKNGKRLRGRY